MALAKDPSLYSSSSSTLLHQLSNPSIYRFDHHHHHDKMGHEQKERDTSTTFVKQLQMINPKGFVFDSLDHHHEEAYDGSNFLSFVQDESSPDQESYTKTSEREHDEYSSLWAQNYNNCSTYGILMNNHTIHNGREKVNHDDDGDMFGLSFSNEEDDIGATRIAGSNKRHHSNMGGDNMQALKKQCNGTNNTSEKVKSKTVSTSNKDPQSLAAKNRRERISERLKVLQELVPNGCKVDLVTMLEKAISYVKFLQLQVKVLATDEFCPAQEGEAPEISQVKEAIDAILSSQREKLKLAVFP